MKNKTRKVHTKLHPESEWCIVNITTTEGTDDVT